MMARYMCFMELVCSCFPFLVMTEETIGLIVNLTPDILIRIMHVCTIVHFNKKFCLFLDFVL